MATLVREVISFMWLYIIYQSLLIQVYVKKKNIYIYIYIYRERERERERERNTEKNRLYVPLYHSSWGMGMDVTSCYIKHI